MRRCGTLAPLSESPGKRGRMKPSCPSGLEGPKSKGTFETMTHSGAVTVLTRATRLGGCGNVDYVSTYADFADLRPRISSSESRSTRRK